MISGLVSDTEGNPLSFVNVVLYDSNQNYIDVKSSEQDGSYTFDLIMPGDYYLQASLIGYNDYTSDTFNITDRPKTRMISLSQDENILNTVEIVGKKPLLEQRADRLVVNVADNLTSLNTSMQDVMKKIPGVIIINDRLSLAGQSNVTILINGKTTKYMDMESLLQDMPGDNIQKVEVITNPGAEFEASGTGPVINIILKKNLLQGTNGSVRVGVEHTDQIGYTGGLSMSHIYKGLNLQGNIGYAKSNWREELIAYRHIARVGGFTDYDQFTDDFSERDRYYGGGTIDYTINDHHTIGINGRGVLGKRIGEKSATTKIIDSDEAVQNLITDNNGIRDYDYFTVNPYYTLTLDSTGHKLNADFNYVRFQSDDNSTQFNTVSSGSFQPIDQEYEQPGTSKLWTAQLDYSKPISKNVTLKSGLRFSQSDLDNNNIRYDIIDQKKVLNALQSNHYLFNEDVQAIYLKGDMKSGDYSFSAGLRYESSQSEGYSITVDSTLTRDINKLFPSFGISGPLMGSLGWAADYSYRIERPSFWTLNPFVYYYDPFTYEQGNPNILPETTHSGKVSITYDSQPFLQFLYSYTDDAMVNVTEQNDVTGETARRIVNLAERVRYGVNLFFPLDMISGGFLNGYGGVMYYNKAYKGLVQESTFDQNADAVDLFIQGNFSLPADIKTEFGAWYTSGGLEDILRYKWMYGTSLGFSKTFLDKALKISIGIEDPTNRFFNASFQHVNQDIQVENRWSNKNINLQVQYKFGNQYAKKKKLNRNIESESSRLNRD